MSKQDRRPAAQPAAGKKAITGTVSPEPKKGFRAPYPMLLLAIAAVVLYAPSLSFGLTELDDSIFIREFHEYNEHIRNLITSFQRGLFDAVKDPYYRPLFMDTMILNYIWADHGQNIMSYHIINLLFHIGAVLLLYRLLLKLNVSALHSFLLSLVFTVHPVLTQAVAWIPGRNDTLLAIFVLSFLLNVISYVNEGRIRSLLLSTLFLLLAFFTKETAVFAAPVAFVLLMLVLNRNWLEKRITVQYAIWAGCFILWYVVRAKATVHTEIAPAQVLHDFIPRLPLIVQYLGKVFLPFNLSVFPIQQDTVYYYGIGAVVILAAIVALNKERNMKAILAGLAVFLLFLLPVLFVPSKLNEQTFEHRLYLPIMGILMLLPQTILLRNKLSDRMLAYCWVGAAAVLSVINFSHQNSFESPQAFWGQAAETSPHSAYANMMLAARLDDVQQSYVLFRKAYQLNPKEKYLNFYYGVMLQKQDSVAASEKYLLTEKNTTGYYECDFYLARVAMERKDFTAAIDYLRTYLKTDPANTIANNNLILLYIDTHQPEKAKEHIRTMQQKGVEVPTALKQQLGM